MSILCKSLDISFDGIVYLENINLKIPANKIVLLSGPSGSGKTALFNVFCGLISPPNKEAKVFWSDYEVINLNDANKERYKYMSLIYSHFYFLQSLSVKENIILPAVFAKKSKKEINDKLEMLYSVFSFEDDVNITNLNLKDMTQKAVRDLSNGQKELVGIARAFMLNVPFIFADEMLRSYNRETEQAIWERIMSIDLGIGKNRGLFLITHKEHLKSDSRIHIIYTIEDKKLKRL